MNEKTAGAPEIPTVEPIDFLAQYRALCAVRDQVNAVNAPLEAALAEQVAIAEIARVKASEIASQIDANRGGVKWLAMKTQIAQLARALGKIPTA